MYLALMMANMYRNGKAVHVSLENM